MNTCQVCGKTFEADKPERKYCSLVCSYASRKGHLPTNPKRRIAKVCENCGKTFEAGGRSGKHSWTKYCSRQCAGVGAIRHPMPNVLSPMHASYLAGFFDGEGSLVHVKKHGWRMVVYQSSEPVIRWIEQITGTGTVAIRESNGSNLKKVGVLKPAFVWQLYGRNAVALLEQLIPYLIVKKEKAMRVVEFYKNSAGG